MKIILAPDSFKGSISALEAANAMAQGIQEIQPAFELVILPAADGGEGTMSNLVAATDGEVFGVAVQDPLGRKVVARYGVLGDKETCVVEIAEASGLTLLMDQERNPVLASTYGTGELILHALNSGFRKFIIGLGGSATNDGGVGMLQALGMKFLNQNGEVLAQGGGALRHLHKIDQAHFDKRVSESSFLIACDVENPLVGLEGASAIFGPQKGATPDMVHQLDGNLLNYADVVERMTGISLHEKKGAGAAGGAGGAFQVFFTGEMKRGIDVVLEAIGFEGQLVDADLIVTGEGKTDAQTLSGKTPFGIAEAAMKIGKPVILISGMVDETSVEMLLPYFTEVHSVVDETVSAEESMEEAFHHLKMKTKKVIEEYIKN
ncbi:glycerate kinase [Paenisporosarcina sp. TG-14]|uniref:glycerate kinase n=1 Tax=Paenisporosarcina sp. TG-14 TaxID=1231057 RepID=UPI00031F2611|nr:glycerate kinase [Paenisporosarcina sp. TG-14]